MIYCLMSYSPVMTRCKLYSWCINLETCTWYIQSLLVKYSCRMPHSGIHWNLLYPSQILYCIRWCGNWNKHRKFQSLMTVSPHYLQSDECEMGMFFVAGESLLGLSSKVSVWEGQELPHNTREEMQRREFSMLEVRVLCYVSRIKHEIQQGKFTSVQMVVQTLAEIVYSGKWVGRHFSNFNLPKFERWPLMFIWWCGICARHMYTTHKWWCLFSGMLLIIVELEMLLSNLCLKLMP